MSELLSLLFGMALQPHVALLVDYWMNRPHRMAQSGYYDICQGCSIR